MPLANAVEVDALDVLHAEKLRERERERETERGGGYWFVCFGGGGY